MHARIQLGIYLLYRGKHIYAPRQRYVLESFYTAYMILLMYIRIQRIRSAVLHMVVYRSCYKDDVCAANCFISNARLMFIYAQMGAV